MSSEKDLSDTITDALTNPHKDVNKNLQIIVSAIVDRSIDRDTIEQAVKQTVSNYENQLRVFMVAVANAHLPRVIKLLKSVDLLEEELQTDRIVKMMDAKDLLKSYALMQLTLVQSLDYVKKIADMRVELQQAQKAITNGLSNEEVSEIDDLSQLPKLDVSQRNRVRSIIDAMLLTVQESAVKEEAHETTP